jgi:hypothetical protein
MHPQEAGIFHRGQRDQTVAILVELAEVMLLRDRHQVALVRIGPGMERTRKARALPARIVLDDRSAVSAGIQEGVEHPRPVARREYGNPEIRQGHEAARLRQVGTEPDDLGIVAKEVAPFPLRQLGRDVDFGGISPHAAGIDVGVLVEMGHQFFEEADLFALYHEGSFGAAGARERITPPWGGADG